MRNPIDSREHITTTLLSAHGYSSRRNRKACGQGEEEEEEEEVVVVDSQQPYWYQRTTSSRNRGELVSAPENPPTVTCATNRTEQAD